MMDLLKLLADARFWRKVGIAMEIALRGNPDLQKKVADNIEKDKALLERLRKR